MSRVVIMRRPVLHEDEGRSFLEKICDSEQEAKDWIKLQEKEYFGPGDYYILKEPK